MWINIMWTLFKNLFGIGQPKQRSSEWPKVKREHLKNNPNCETCGKTDKITVHHILPFHLFPNKELDSKNLITLCEGDICNCHLVFGHWFDWKKYNPDIVREIPFIRKILGRGD